MFLRNFYMLDVNVSVISFQLIHAEQIDAEKRYSFST
jgi:hypothetical protein